MSDQPNDGYQTEQPTDAPDDAHADSPADEAQVGAKVPGLEAFDDAPAPEPTDFQIDDAQSASNPEDSWVDAAPADAAGDLNLDDAADEAAAHAGDSRYADNPYGTVQPLAASDQAAAPADPYASSPDASGAAPAASYGSSPQGPADPYGQAQQPSAAQAPYGQAQAAYGQQSAPYGQPGQGDPYAQAPTGQPQSDPYAQPGAYGQQQPYGQPQQQPYAPQQQPYGQQQPQSGGMQTDFNALTATPDGFPPVGMGATSPSSEQSSASMAHWLAILIQWLGPLIMMLTAGEKSAFVKEHAKESLNFELTLLIGYLLSGFLMTVGIGFITYPIVWVVGLIFHIQGAGAAGKGQPYRYPFAIRLIK